MIVTLVCSKFMLIMRSKVGLDTLSDTQTQIRTQLEKPDRSSKIHERVLYWKSLNTEPDWVYPKHEQVLPRSFEHMYTLTLIYIFHPICNDWFFLTDFGLINIINQYQITIFSNLNVCTYICKYVSP